MGSFFFPGSIPNLMFCKIISNLGARHGGKARVTEIPEGGFAPPDPPTEFPEGGFAPPDPPTTTFQKICPPGKFFEMIETGGAPPPQTPPREKNDSPKKFSAEKFAVRTVGSFFSPDTTEGTAYVTSAQDNTQMHSFALSRVKASLPLQ